IAALAACGGGGSSSPGVAGVAPPVGGGSHAPNLVSLTVKIPSSSSSPGAKRGAYVSPGTQSIGVVVTNQGATPGPAQYTNVSSCPQVSGVTTCTISVAALPGNDAFTVSAYSAQNGGGAVLSSGSITSTIVEGQANTTMPVTMGGVISSIVVTPGIATLPLGQSTTLNVAAKDASGATIVGSFDNPIALTASNLTLSTASVSNSTDASKVTAAWQLGVSTDTPTTVSATGDGVTGTVSMTPGTGFAYYQAGTNSATDNGSVKMIAGPDGKLYYTSIGVVSCTNNNICAGQIGAVHQFDPTMAKDTSVALQSSGIGLTFTSDGALWIGGGAEVSGSSYIYRMAPGTFSSAGLTPIAVPTPSRGSPNMRVFAQDGSGNVWFVDRGGHRLLKIPLAGPYTASSITTSTLPGGPSGTTPHYAANGAAIGYVNGSLVIPDQSNGVVDVANPSTGSVTGQYVTNLQAGFASPTIDVSNPYDMTSDSANAYVAQIGNWNAGGTALGSGDIEQFNVATHAFTTLNTVAGPVSQSPTVPSVNGSVLYYVDFSLSGLGYVNLSTNTARLFPTGQLGTSYFYGAGAIAAMSDGTAWFPCYGSAPTFQPLCVGHSVYFAKWSIWPSSSIAIYGAGTANGQLVGIMESPSSNSGPFTIASSDTSICTVTQPATNNDHNFIIAGKSAGACTVTVTDKNSVSRTISVTVTTTSGTVQVRKAGV
ncbi:MAG TPA: hypothetical protein VFN49_09010, partial [Candidatus Aquilonibacter sp.]|nr:hypothetical protein [Candidatus Aquilonibacter sp.]